MHVLELLDLQARLLEVVHHGEVPLAAVGVDGVALLEVVEEPVHLGEGGAAVLNEEDHARGLQDALHLTEGHDGVAVVAETEHVDDTVEFVVLNALEVLGLDAADLVLGVRGLRDAVAEALQLLRVGVG
eukprot:402641_1